MSFCRHTTKFARLTQSQAMSQSIAFSSLSDQWEIRRSFTFIHFSKLFLIYNYCFLYHAYGDQKISWWKICKWRAVNFEIHLCSSGVNSDLGECFFWGLCKPVIASTNLWPQRCFGNACNGHVWKQFRCLSLSKEACGAPPPPVALAPTTFWLLYAPAFIRCRYNTRY